MLYTDKEILETIREARSSLCDIMFSLLDFHLKSPEAAKVAIDVNAQLRVANAYLRAASEMCSYNIRKRYPEEYDD